MIRRVNKKKKKNGGKELMLIMTTVEKPMCVPEEKAVHVYLGVACA